MKKRFPDNINKNQMENKANKNTYEAVFLRMRRNRKQEKLNL